MEISSTQFKHCDLVKLSGRVDSSTSPQLNEILNAILSNDRFHIVMDLGRGSQFMSSAGLRVLINTQKQCKRFNRGEVVLASVPQNIYGALDLAGFIPLFKIFKDQTTAVGHFSVNKPRYPRQMVFRGLFINLAAIASFVREACLEAGFTTEAIYQVETAVDEACTNIIEHAYCGEGKGDIFCSCDAAPGVLTVTLKDTGRPFDPAGVPVPDRECPLDERESHGLGLFLFYQLMDEVRFNFSDPNYNVLVMTKRKG